MRIGRRLLGASLQCALLIMPLAGARSDCAPADIGQPYTAMAGMPGMAMPGMPGMPGMPMPRSSDSGDPQGSAPPDCSLPWAPGTCAQMSSCAPSAMNAPAATIVRAQVLRHNALAALSNQPRSVTRAPEPPPPRA